ncbi:MAG: hypothetical protein NC223_11040, partial [Butyrivibrio sp.]|nr:hypothetical protein [Butyrivibrio sp.]
EGKYILDFGYIYNDVTISEDEKLYLKVNLGETASGNFFLALICDGETIKLDGENDIIGIVMDNGKKMFQCEVPTDGMESGLHYYQVVVLQQNADSLSEMYECCTERYRAVIEN